MNYLDYVLGGFDWWRKYRGGNWERVEGDEWPTLTHTWERTEARAQAARSCHGNAPSTGLSKEEKGGKL